MQERALVGVVTLVAPLAILGRGYFASYASVTSLQRGLMIMENRFPGKMDEQACLFVYTSQPDGYS